MLDTEELAASFVRLSDTLVDDFDVVDLLRDLVHTCVGVMDMSASGLLLAGEGDRLHVVAASSENAHVLELFQIQRQEGPCFDCFRSGSPVRVARLNGARTRWPQFAEAASGRGYVHALALPMRLRGQMLGALGLMGDTRAPVISEDAIHWAQAMADVATIAILTDRLARDRGLLTDQLQFALNGRVLVEQAKGALATRLDIDQEAAFVLLRRHARGQRRPLREVAEEVITTRPGGDWQQYQSDEGGPSETGAGS